MASYFGEIIEPTSRAIFDDSSDEEETNEQYLLLSWTKDDQKPPSALEVIFVFHGRLSLAFAEAFLLDENSSPEAEINVYEKCPEDSSSCKRKDYPSRIYIEEGRAICLVSPKCPSELAHNFTTSITNLLEVSKKVIIFTNDSIHNYKALSLNKLPPAFFRQLKTTSNCDKYVVEKLPDPNFIIGVPAAVLSWCEIFQKNACGFICYSDQEELDSITAKPFLQVLQKLQYFHMIKNDKPNFRKSTFYGQPQIIGGSSNIYI